MASSNAARLARSQGIGTIFPQESLLQVELSRRAAAGDPEADLRARELAAAFSVLARFDEGVDLVLYFKHLMVLKGEEEYRLNIYETDALSASQAKYCEAQFHQFNAWFAKWVKQGGGDRAMHVIDSHTGGEPTRVILDGGPDLGAGGPLAARAKALATQHGDFTRSVMLEPRGQVAMVAALLVPPTDPTASRGG